MQKMKEDFSSVTELPGRRAHKRQLSQIHTRYDFARKYCQDNDVLEVACGCGFGLPFLAEKARKVVGGDIDETNLGFAEKACDGYENIEVMQMDAEMLPFDDNSFDAVIICEANYYLPNVDAFFAEAARVLRPNGNLIVVSVNRDWHGFNPSPFSKRYLNSDELVQRLSAANFSPEIQFGFRTDKKSVLGKGIALVRQTAVKLGLIPKTMKGKEWLKRMFYGKLEEIDSSLKPDIAPLYPLVPFEDAADRVDEFEVIYATGRLNRNYDAD